MSQELLQKKCVPCEGGVPPLSAESVADYMEKVDAWTLMKDEEMKIEKKFTFKDFERAMEFVNEVAGLAEAEGHHPNIHVSYNVVTLTLWTHAASGLTENDFIMAAKIDQVPRGSDPSR